MKHLPLVLMLVFFRAFLYVKILFFLFVPVIMGDILRTVITNLFLSGK